jgi:hypothetical protein
MIPTSKRLYKIIFPECRIYIQASKSDYLAGFEIIFLHSLDAKYTLWPEGIACTLAFM